MQKKYTVHQKTYNSLQVFMTLNVLAFAKAFENKNNFHKDLVIYNTNNECQTFVWDSWFELWINGNDEAALLYGMELFVANIREKNHVMMCETWSWQCQLKSGDNLYKTSPQFRNRIANIVVPGIVMIKE